MAAAPTVNAPPEMIAAATWMTNQYDFSAGTSCGLSL